MDSKKKKTKVKGRRSIKTQLMLIMSLLVAIPVAVLSIISLVITRNEGIRSSMELNDAQAKIIEENIENILNQNVMALQSLATSPTTKEYIEGDTSHSTEILHQIRVVDEENLADGNSTVVTGPDGKQLLRNTGNLVDVSEREYFKQAMAGKTYVSDINVSKTTGSRIVTFAVPVYNEAETKVIGIIQRNYDLSVLHDLLASEVTENKQEIVMVDRTGSVIAHSGHEITADNPEDQSANPFYTDSRGDKANGDYIAKFGNDTWMVSWVKESHTGWVVASCRVQSVALAHVTNMTLLLLILGVASIVVGMIIAFLIAKSYAQPVALLNDSLADLSNGKFTDIDKFTNRKDEFGEMINATNTVIDKIRGVVVNLKDVMKKLGDSSNSLADTAGQISQTADDVSGAVEGIARGATEQAETVQKATENMNSLSEAIQDVANNAEGLASTATSMNDSSTSSAEALRDLAANMESMIEAMAEISEGMSATNAAVQGVNERVDGITSIASQTNLLALNASIEAARAGEAGRGFAVVAEEIGKLATESAQTADEIRGEMAKLLKQSQNAMMKTGEVTEKSGTFNDVLNDTVNKINELIGGVGTTVDGVTTISGLSEESAANKTIIVDAMDSLSAISQENAASTEQTSASMQELNATVNLLAESADHLNGLAKTLEEELEFFKV